MHFFVNNIDKIKYYWVERNKCEFYYHFIEEIQDDTHSNILILFGPGGGGEEVPSDF